MTFLSKMYVVDAFFDMFAPPSVYIAIRPALIRRDIIHFILHAHSSMGTTEAVLF